MTFYIYKIKGINYIGSTNDIKKRTQLHKSNCYNENRKDYNLLVYHYIREKEIDIELEILGVYKKECSKRIKLLVEQFYINKYDSVNNGLNSYNAFTNKKKYMKIYYEKNKKRINEKKNKNYQKKKEKINMKINCPKCNSLISKQHLKRHQKSKKCKKLSQKFPINEYEKYKIK